MKMLFGCLLVMGLAGVVSAAPRDVQIIDVIGPATSATEVTISTSGLVNRNCLTSVTVISDAAYTFRILTGGTTIYSLTMGANSGLAKEWPPTDPICGDPNRTLILKCSAGTYSINYQGYSY